MPLCTWIDSSECSFQLHDETLMRYKYTGCTPDKALTRIVGLHGWLDNANTFDHLAPHLLDGVAATTCLVSLDFAGHGLSGRRNLGSYYLEVDRIAEVHTLLSHLGWLNYRTALLAHSYGQSIAVLFAGSFPTLVSHVICLDGFGTWINPGNDYPSRVRDSVLALPQWPTKQGRLWESRDTAIAKYQFNRSMDKIQLSSVETLAKRGLKAEERKGQHGFVWRHDPRCIGLTVVKYGESELHSFLQNITAPILVMFSDISLARLGPHVKEVFISRRKYCKEVTFVSAPGGHHFHLDHPQLLAPTLKTFLFSNKKIPSSL